MIPMATAQLADILAGDLVGDPSIEVTGVGVVDSRQAAAGDLFFALSGEQADGHHFVDAAARQGAVAAVVERPVETDTPQIVVNDGVAALARLARWTVATLRDGGLRTIGITGTVGKTTTKDLTAALLAQLGPTIAPVRSFNNHIGVPLTALRATTQTRFLVSEMGTDSPGDIDLLTSIVPLDVAVVLRVGRGHLEGFGDSIDALAHEKSRILAGLVPGGQAVLNQQDGRVAQMAAKVSDPLWFGEDRAGGLAITDVQIDEQGRAGFILGGRDGSAQLVKLGLFGAHHLGNAAAAITVADHLGLGLQSIVQVLVEHSAVSPHRMAVTDTAQGWRLIDDSYNANPESMRAALQALVTMGRGHRTIAVLGQMWELGQDSILEHDAVGRLAVRLNVSQVLAVGAGAYPIHTGAYQEGSWDSESLAVDDIDSAYQWLTENVQPGDVVLVKSSNAAGLHRLAHRLVEWGTQ